MRAVAASPAAVERSRRGLVGVSVYQCMAAVHHALYAPSWRPRPSGLDLDPDDLLSAAARRLSSFRNACSQAPKMADTEPEQ